jgi:hypothetical protein
MRLTGSLLCALALAGTLWAPANAGAIIADEDKEREIRSLLKQVSKLEKRYDKLLVRCRGDEQNRPDARACNDAQVVYLDVQQLRRRIGRLSDEDAS